MVTAGHCVHGGGSGEDWHRVNSFRVYPGRDGSASPYGSCTAKRLYSVRGWTRNAADTSDYGAIKLNCNIGNRVGWFGFFWSRTSLDNLPLRISGYPGDKNLTQWRDSDRVRVSQKKRVFYGADTLGGQSGSPVYYNRSSNCNPCSMAVHAYGIYGSFPFSTYNHGTRITQGVYQNLNDWKNAN